MRLLVTQKNETFFGAKVQNFVNFWRKNMKNCNFLAQKFKILKIFGAKIIFFVQNLQNSLFETKKFKIAHFGAKIWNNFQIFAPKNYIFLHFCNKKLHFLHFCAKKLQFWYVSKNGKKIPSNWKDDITKEALSPSFHEFLFLLWCNFEKKWPPVCKE